MSRLHAAFLLLLMFSPTRSASAGDAVAPDGDEASRPHLANPIDGPPASSRRGDVPADLPAPDAAVD